MTPMNFIYWLRGFLEANGSGKIQGLSQEQVDLINEHINKIIPEGPIINIPNGTNPLPWTTPITPIC